MSYLINAVGSATIKNGVLECPQYGIMASAGVVNLENIKITAKERCLSVYDDATVNMDKDCVFETTGNDVTVCVWGDAGKKAVFNCEGKIKNSCENGNYAIGGNGTDTSDTTINIFDGAEIISLNDSAIFHSQSGKLNVNGGLIEGKDGIYQKAGVVHIYNGEIHGVGDGQYSYSGNGSNAIGHAVLVDFVEYVTGTPKLVIDGGNFVSEHKEAFKAYMPKTKQAGSEAFVATDNNEKLNAFIAENIEINGGEFSPEL